MQQRACLVSVCVWHRDCGAPRKVFGFSGAVDPATLCAIVQHVGGLGRAIRGRWFVDVVAVQVQDPLVRELLARLCTLPRTGVRLRLADRRRKRAQPRARFVPPAAASPAVVLH